MQLHLVCQLIISLHFGNWIPFKARTACPTAPSIHLPNSWCLFAVLSGYTILFNAHSHSHTCSHLFKNKMCVLLLPGSTAIRGLFHIHVLYFAVLIFQPVSSLCSITSTKMMKTHNGIKFNINHMHYVVGFINYACLQISSI